ncbi:hypothetical protein [Reinekea thalattae]|uniref:hypothetical protein n=1 Tax=Reinekea thalattae TaxID=2593301 RepID=UPI0016503235|nr:hypothetical protein [Reinekea thalattae]
MPALAWYLVAGGIAAFGLGAGVNQAGDAVDDVSTGALKLAGAALLGAGALAIYKKVT